MIARVVRCVLLLQTTSLLLMQLLHTGSGWTHRAIPTIGMNVKKMQKTIAATSLAFAAVFGGSPLFLLQRADALGPKDLDLSITSYKRVELCDGRKPIMPGQKAAEGLFPACIEVEANIKNPSGETLKDVSIYGFVKDDEAGNSVLPNNPDFKSDSGQYAMIKTVPPGESKITFQFVAAVTADPTKGPISKLTFFKTKAVSFPGGDRFKPLGECEIDPRADGCPGTEDE